MIARNLPLPCLLALSLVGCPGPASPTSIPIEAFATELATAQCDYAARCGFSLESAERSLLREQITDCAPQLAGALEASTIGALRAAIEEGTIAYHADLAAGCLGRSAEVSCAETLLVVGCEGVFEGMLTDGEPCSLAEQCGAQSTCNASRLGMCPSGVCVHVPQLGESCAASDCALDAFCADGVCAARLPEGASCVSGGCEASLACLSPDGDPAHAVCTSPISLAAGLGEACGLCQSGLVCSPTSRTCRAPLSDGSCEQVSYGEDDCVSGQECVVTSGPMGVCMPLPTLGEPCTAVCARGSRCTPSASGIPTCAVPIEDGASCLADRMCLSGFCAAGACAPPPVCRTP